MDAPTLEQILDTCRKQGYIVLGNYFSKKTTAKLLAEAMQVYENNGPCVAHGEKEGLSNDYRLFGVENRCDGINREFAQNELFARAASQYMGTSQSTHACMLGVLRVPTDGKPANSGGGWHRDSHGKQFKAIVYLTDANEHNGCFQFVTRSRTNMIGNPQPRTTNYSTRFSDETVANLCHAREECCVRNVSGSAGTVILVDTSYIHRGKPIQTGNRVVLTNYYYAGKANKGACKRKWKQAYLH